MKIAIDARSGTPTAQGWIGNGLIYQHSLINDEQKQIDPAKVEKQAKRHDPSELAIINVEAWHPSDPRYIDLIDLWRTHNRGARVGYYSILPVRHYWGSVLGGEAEQWWRGNNADLSRRRWQDGTFGDRGLADVVDFICPSLYTFYAADDGGYRGRNHEELWFEEYAPKHCQIARAWSKQVYPFVWPRYHDSNRKRRWTYIGDDFFRRQIQWCLDNCDGVIVWDSTYFDRVKHDLGNVVEQSTAVMQEFAL